MPTQPSPGRSLTASAQRIDLRKADAKTKLRGTEKWQDEAWAYYDAVPEVKFAGRFVGNALARCRLFAAVQVQPDEPPVAVKDAANMVAADKAAAGLEWLTPAVAADIDDEGRRLANLRSGQAGLLKSFGVQMVVPGDCYLVATDDPDLGVEDWNVYAAGAIKRQGDTAKIMQTPSDKKGLVLPEDALLYRVWSRHERWPALADSNMRAVLDVCEELLIYSRQFRAVGKSRNSAGLLLLPNELDPPAGPPLADDDDPEGPEAQADAMTPFEASIVDSIVTPVWDDSSAAAVAPHMIRGPKDALAEVRHIPLDRKIDERAPERVNHLIARLAHGLDVPVEVLTGMADLNHWTAWQIEDSTYKAHIEPMVTDIAQALAAVFLRVSVLARLTGTGGDDAPQLEPEVMREWMARMAMLTYGVDPSRLVVRPNRGQDAKDAHKALVLSDAALLRYLGFSDTDAPDEDELVRRYTLERGIGGVKLTKALLELEGLVPVGSLPDVSEGQGSEADGGGGADGAEDDQPTPVAAAGVDWNHWSAWSALAQTRTAAALVAAGAQDVGAQLAAIDTQARERTQGQAEAAMVLALRRAGSRLRSQVQHGNPEARAAVNGAAAEDVAAILVAGNWVTAADVDAALEGAFDDVAAGFDRTLAQAQGQVRQVLAQQVADVQAVDAALGPYDARAEDNRDAAVLFLVAGLLALARLRVHRPDLALAEDPGEVDVALSVPPVLVRDAVARAGGGLEPGAAPAGMLEPGVAGGVATGPDAMAALGQLHAAVVGWRWQVGIPQRPFPPHQALAGTVFTSWSDPVLAASNWTFGHYFPGDHRGCQCDAVPLVVLPGQQALLPVP